jgi:hypothetical protein
MKRDREKGRIREAGAKKIRFLASSSLVFLLRLVWE